MSEPGSGEGFSRDQQGALNRLDRDMKDHTIPHHRSRRLGVKIGAAVAAGLAVGAVALEAARSHSDVIRNPEQATVLMLKATDALARRIATTQPREDEDTKITATKEVVDKTAKTPKLRRILNITDKKPLEGQPTGCTITLTTIGPDSEGKTDDIRLTTTDGMKLDINLTDGKIDFVDLPPSNLGYFGHSAPGPEFFSLHLSTNPRAGEQQLQGRDITGGTQLLKNVAGACLDPQPSNSKGG